MFRPYSRILNQLACCETLNINTFNGKNLSCTVRCFDRHMHSEILAIDNQSNISIISHRTYFLWEEY